MYHLRDFRNGGLRALFVEWGRLKRKGSEVNVIFVEQVSLDHGFFGDQLGLIFSTSKYCQVPEIDVGLVRVEAMLRLTPCEVEVGTEATLAERLMKRSFQILRN
jgi:hypothetical protein